MRTDLVEGQRSRVVDARILVMGLVLVGLLSLYLAMNRVYQVDEAQDAYSAWIQGAGLSYELFTQSPLYLMPFAFLSRHLESAESVFRLLRGGFWVIWWVNLTLLAWAAGGGRLRSAKTMGLMLLAAMSPPLWTYGLEVRHENVLLTGLLALWMLGRREGGNGPWRYAAMGLIAIAMQASTFKSLAYWGPLCAWFLAFPNPSLGSRLKLLAYWAGGAVVALLLAGWLEWQFGSWPAFWRDQTGFLHGAGTVMRFSPMATINKAVTQIPLLLAAVIIPTGMYLYRMSRPRDRVELYAGPLPEVLLFLWCLALLLVNPNPFPYNLLTVVATAFLAASALVGPLLEEMPWRPGLLPVAAGLLLFVQGVPLFLNSIRLWESDNTRQVQLMEAAENLTDPARDRVYDSAGLVPTRKSIGYMWFMNIANVDAYKNGTLTPFMTTFRANPPAVVIPTYRFSYMDAADLKEIERDYIALAPDLWVAGHVFAQSDESWVCKVPGRYRFKILSEAEGLEPMLDGSPLPSGPIQLSEGPHAWHSGKGAQTIAVRVGPFLDDPPRLEGEPVPGVFPIPNAF